MTRPGTPKTLYDVRTPALVLDAGVLERNTSRMASRMREMGVNLRPHLKTAKSAQVARMATKGHSGGITVSTLNEAAYFADEGFRDITYAVGITPDKLGDVHDIQSSGVAVHILTDDVETACAIASFADAERSKLSVFIDVDSGYHRSGVAADSERVIEIAKALTFSPNVTLNGVLTHGGHSGSARSIDCIRAIAEEERAACVTAAKRLRQAGFACPEVSVGSTPTAIFGESYDGVTECRPGNYMFFDLFMVALGVCDIEDVAVSVLTSVIVSRPERNYAAVDAGALALSKDTGANFGTMEGIGYGLVHDALNRRDITDTVVRSVSQEHGWLGPRSEGETLPMNDLEIGQRLRILPNHSCLTAAGYDEYVVVNGDEAVVDVWPRTNGW